MNKLFKYSFLISFLALIGCGGGGGSSSTSTSSSSNSSVVSGVASAGAPITNATITILSSNGQYFNPNVSTGTDGSFQFSLDTNAYPTPLLIRVSKTTGQSIGTYYSYVSGNNLTGLIITPISNAVVSLASNRNLDQIFESGTIPTNLSSATINNALGQVAKVLDDKLTALGVSNTSLLNNSSYSADGTGQDSLLDAYAFKSIDADSGKILVTSKLTGKSVQVENGQSVSGINKIPSSSNSVNLFAQIVNKINQVNTCIKNAVNQNISNPSCIDDNFKDSGVTKSNLISSLRNDIGIISSIGNASIRFCTFDNSSKTFESSAINLANETGICIASFELTASNGAGLGTYYYRFTLNSGGTLVSDLKAYGNGLEDTLEINPQIYVKKRVDGYSTNIGITSGYSIEIGTAKNNSTKNLSAKVEIIDSSGTNLQTIYMQCQQGASCQNSRLTLCASNSSTCASGYDTTADSVVSVNSTLSQNIIQALQAGFVSARITAYNKILSDNSKSVNFVKTVPIIGIPIAQNIADNLSYPNLSTNGVALKTWAGENSLTLNFERGDPKIFLYNVSFNAQPSANYNSKDKNITRNVTSATFTGLRKSGSSSILNLNNCPALSGEAVWRGIYFNGQFNNVDVIVKTFGSCSSSDY